LGLAVAGVAAAGPADQLRPGEWYEVPSSHLRDVAPKEGQFSGTWGVEGPPAVMNDWSGGAYDSQRDQLIIWGGGHGGYAGNEVYVFDLATLAWKRLTDPSTPPGVDVPYAPDGAPTSRHTYGYVVYAPPPLDRFCTFGGAGFFQSGQTGTDHVDCFDPGAHRWETQRFADVTGNHIGALSAYDPVTRHLWYHAAFDASLMELNPDTKQWAKRGASYYLDYYKTAEIDPRRRKLVAIGMGDVVSWDIGATGTIAPTKLTTTGATAIVGAASPGLAYDQVSDRLVAWSGGADVYTLDLDSQVWNKIAPASTNATTPTAPNSTGTFGRFRYIPSRNAFIVVNGVDEDVFIYKLTAGGGIDGGSSSDGGTRDASGAAGAAMPPAAGGTGGAPAKGKGGTSPAGGCSCRVTESAGDVRASAWALWMLAAACRTRRPRRQSRR
jgi:hypothetical protein